jgi:hypothetical protein
MEMAWDRRKATFSEKQLLTVLCIDAFSRSNHDNIDNDLRPTPAGFCATNLKVGAVMRNKNNDITPTLHSFEYILPGKLR